MPKYDLAVTPYDGNAFSIMAAVSGALRKEGVPDEVVEQYFAESTSGDYNNLLRVAMEYVRLEV
jgi:hypothetical protein